MGQVSKSHYFCVSVQAFAYYLKVYPSQELDEIRKSGIRVFREILVDESNILNWQGLIVPVSSVNIQCVCVCVSKRERECVCAYV